MEIILSGKELCLIPGLLSVLTFWDFENIDPKLNKERLAAIDMLYGRLFTRREEIYRKHNLNIGAETFKQLIPGRLDVNASIEFTEQDLKIILEAFTIVLQEFSDDIEEFLTVSSLTGYNIDIEYIKKCKKRLERYNDKAQVPLS